MKKLFIVASLAFAVSFTVAEVVTLKVRVGIKDIQNIDFEVSKGREGVANLLYDYCTKLPKKTINALNKEKFFENELSFVFDNPVSVNTRLTGQPSHIGNCKFDKVKGTYKLVEINGEDAVVKQGLSKENIIANVTDGLILYYDAMSSQSAFRALEEVAEFIAEQKSQKEKK